MSRKVGDGKGPKTVIKKNPDNKIMDNTVDLFTTIENEQILKDEVIRLMSAMIDEIAQ